MHTLKCIGIVLSLGFCPAVWAHPGHPAVSLAHSHAAYGFDPQFTLWLIATVNAVIVIGYAFRCMRRSRAPR